ncbi:MAG: nitrogen fixation protein NifZ [Hydrogenothermaceae bacterium]|nr:nitrogen fixation protein NifZ [Hydrogenothermaceae bacterium]
MAVSKVYETFFRENYKVRVKKDIKNDGTFPGYKLGELIVEKGSEGYVKEIGEFLFKPVIFVHFLDKNIIVGFREEELEVIEYYDFELGKWIKVTK